jgi:hypothetical protein
VGPENFMQLVPRSWEMVLMLSNFMLLVLRYLWFFHTVNPLPHGVLATFNLTAGGLLRPPEEGDISREKTILMTSLQVL